MSDKANDGVQKEVQKDYHKLSIKTIFKEFGSSEKGISKSQLAEKRKVFGYNRLSEKKETPIIIRFLLQFHNFFSYLLILGSILSFISEEIFPGQGSIYIAYALIGVTILNAVFTFVQEYRAEQAMKSFKNLMTSKVVVLRDGEKLQLDSTALVPGDIMLLSEGDRITADARLIEVKALKVDHSSLTGESEPQLRSLEATSDNILLSRNMVFSGTLVQSGSGTAVVVATGDSTQIGAIAKTTSEVATTTSHLQMEIAHFIKIISYIAIFLGVTFFGAGVFITKNPFWTNMVFAIGIIVANVPEGLLPTVTLTLSIAAQKMAKRKVLIKNMDAIETLGSITVICSDKTGTLTENNLNVHGFHMNGKFYGFDREGHILQDKKDIRMRSIPGIFEFHDILLLCNNGHYDPKNQSFGDSTDVALKKYTAYFHNNNYIEKEHPRSDEIPFSSESKFMITRNKFDVKEKALIKGAPKIVLNKCSHYFDNGKVKKLTKAKREEFLDVNRKFASEGFRILAAASKIIQGKSKSKFQYESDYCYYGFIILQDPPRKEVPDAVRLCQNAGIKIIVISGDQATTVENIARQVGIVGKKPLVIKGPDIPDYSDDQLKKFLQHEEVVIARALPKDKLRIVSLLKDMGEIVAVTGDGVNDAPALKKADVGVAMGKSGTEVAKEAADAVLLDDNFASIVRAVQSGRTVYDNIKNFITYILTSNTPEIVPFLMFVLFGWPLALPVLLILAIDLGTDMIPAIGLGVEPSTCEIMNRSPRNPKSKLLNWKMVARSYGFIGPLQTTFAYIIFFKILFAGGWSWGEPLAVTNHLYYSAITGFFATVIVVQMFNVFACRTTRASVFTKGVFSNKFIWLGIFSEALLLLLIIHISFVEKVFGTAPFSLYYFGYMFFFGLLVLVLEELRKLVFRMNGRFGVD